MNRLPPVGGAPARQAGKYPSLTPAKARIAQRPTQSCCSVPTYPVRIHMHPLVHSTKPPPLAAPDDMRRLCCVRERATRRVAQGLSSTSPTRIGPPGIYLDNLQVAHGEVARPAGGSALVRRDDALVAGGGLQRAKTSTPSSVHILLRLDTRCVSSPSRAPRRSSWGCI